VSAGARPHLRGARNVSHVRERSLERWKRRNSESRLLCYSVPALSAHPANLHLAGPAPSRRARRGRECFWLAGRTSRQQWPDIGGQAGDLRDSVLSGTRGHAARCRLRTVRLHGMHCLGWECMSRKLPSSDYPDGCGDRDDPKADWAHETLGGGLSAGPRGVRWRTRRSGRDTRSSSTG
jgi:hypothetical protein